MPVCRPGQLTWYLNLPLWVLAEVDGMDRLRACALLVAPDVIHMKRLYVVKLGLGRNRLRYGLDQFPADAAGAVVRRERASPICGR